MFVINPMRRVSTFARSAAPTPTNTAIPEMMTTRWSTGTYSGGASTVASAGAKDGATGNPLAAFSGVWDSSGTPDASSRLVLEHHWWGRQIDPTREHPQLEQLGQRGLLLRPHPGHAVDEITLHSRRRTAQQALAGGGQGNVYSTSIGGRRDARHESAVDQAADDDRYRALMRRRPLGEVVQTFCGPVRQLLKHEKLSETDPKLSLDATRVETQRTHDTANSVHCASGVVDGRHVCLCIGRQCIEASAATSGEA